MITLSRNPNDFKEPYCHNTKVDIKYYFTKGARLELKGSKVYVPYWALCDNCEGWYWDKDDPCLGIGLDAIPISEVL